MPALNYVQALTANQLGYNPVSGWQFEYVPAAWGRGAVVSILTNATTTGVRLTAFTGSQTVQQRSPVQGSGTAGLIPSENVVAPLTFMAAPGDRIILNYDEVAGGTPTVNGMIRIEPL
jgi:hypothetical protein